MLKLNTILVGLLIAVLVAYAVYMNIQLKQTVSQYEAMNLEMTKKFAKLNEERARAREEFARKKVNAEEIAVMPVTLPVPTVTKSADARPSIAQPVKQGQSSVAARVTKKEAQQSAARERAEKAKAEVEAMLGKVTTAPEPWEEREPHL